jgi:hypothetical protein
MHRVELLIMLDTVAYQWVSVAFLFLLGSIWSEDNVRFGYILVPFMAGFLWFIGWLQFSYLSSIIPIVIFMGVITYLRAHLKYKYGVFGSSGGLLFKIEAFVIFLVFAIVFINGMAIFNANYVDIPASTAPDYSITSAQSVYAGQTYDLNILTVVSDLLSFTWMSLKMFWSFLLAFFTLIPMLQTQFHLPPALSVLIGAGIYILVGIEVFILIFRPYRSPEI